MEMSFSAYRAQSSVQRQPILGRPTRHVGRLHTVQEHFGACILRIANGKLVRFGAVDLESRKYCIV